jgi:hypothetical protein
MRAVPEVGGVSVVIMRISVVLPAPFGPSSPKISCGDVEADVVHGNKIAEFFRQMVDFNRVHLFPGLHKPREPAFVVSAGSSTVAVMPVNKRRPSLGTAL